MTKPALSAKAGTIRSRLRALCPHCGTPSAIRTSQRLTPLYSELRFVCPNDACGHTWVAGLEVQRTVVPSASPNPDVSIPFAAGRDPAAKAASAS